MKIGTVWTPFISGGLWPGDVISYLKRQWYPFQLVFPTWSGGVPGGVLPYHLVPSLPTLYHITRDTPTFSEVHAPWEDTGMHPWRNRNPHTSRDTHIHGDTDTQLHSQLCLIRTAPAFLA